MTHATFVPGAAGQGSFWSPVGARLPASWRTQLLDLPGLGSISARPEVGSYLDLVGFVAASITTPGVVIAQSMGGFIALALVLRYPELVTHVVLAAVSGGVDMSLHRAADWRASYAATFPEAQPWARDDVPDLSNRLSQIGVPVLLLWATRDPVSPISIAETLKSRIPRASLVTFDTDDHWLARAYPDETASAIIGLIDSDRGA